MGFQPVNHGGRQTFGSEQAVLRVGFPGRRLRLRSGQGVTPLVSTGLGHPGNGCDLGLCGRRLCSPPSQQLGQQGSWGRGSGWHTLCPPQEGRESYREVSDKVALLFQEPAGKAVHVHALNPHGREKMSSHFALRRVLSCPYRPSVGPLMPRLWALLVSHCPPAPCPPPFPHSLGTWAFCGREASLSPSTYSIQPFI